MCSIKSKYPSKCVLWKGLRRFSFAEKLRDADERGIPGNRQILQETGTDRNSRLEGLGIQSLEVLQ